MLYGKEDIPERWLNKLKKREYLTDLGNRYQKLLDDNKKIVFDDNSVEEFEQNNYDNKL